MSVEWAALRPGKGGPAGADSSVTVLPQGPHCHHICSPDLGTVLGQQRGLCAFFLGTGGDRCRVSQHLLRLLGLLSRVCKDPAPDDACLPAQHSLVLGPRKLQLHSCKASRGCQEGLPVT